MNANQTAAKSTKASAKDAAAAAHKAGAKEDDHTSKATKPAAKTASKARQVPKGTLSEKPKMQETAAAERDPENFVQRQGDRRAEERNKADAVMQFGIGQLTSQPAKPPVDMDAFNAELKKLQEQFGVTADVKVKMPRSNQPKQNGIARPGPETTSGKIWGAADEISVKTHSVASIAALREHPAMKGVNEATLKTQYARWRSFHNVQGRLPRIHTLQQDEGVYDEALPKSAGKK